MKKSLFVIIAVLSMSLAVFAQTTNQTTQNASQTETKQKRSPIFRAAKDQIIQAQKMLQVAESGKIDPATRAAAKKYQAENGLRATGTLNRATLEKMNIALSDKQKMIPASANSYASAASGEKSSTPRKAVFRASKDQIMAAQKLMREKSHYAGEQTGKLDPATREGLKKFQAANGVKVTGTLNRETLEKMGIELTGKQKEM